MISRHIISLAACALVCATALAQPPVNLGVNLDDGGAFVNVINHTNRYSNAAGYDAHGWPASDFDLVLMDGRPATEWTGTIDDPEQYRVDYSGRYQSSFIGSASVRATGTSVSIENLAYDASTNTTIFDLIVGGYPNANHGLVLLNFSNTRRSPTDTLHSGITQLKVIRPGYDRSTTKTFTDEYVRLCQAAPFVCYRFYNVQNIWDGEPAYPQQTTWLQRKTPLDASQHTLATLNGKRDGWCWEYVIELANILKRDIWINIHMSCDSDYVANLARKLQAELDPAINIYVESSNEVWSPTQATHGPYNQAGATAHGITFDQNHARRTVELSRWFSSVFGDAAINNRVRVILAGQQSYPGRNDNHLNYIKNTFGEPKNFIYAISSALYFGSTKSTDSDPLRIDDGMIADINDQISTSSSSAYRLNHITKAATWGLKGGCTSYEGGPGIPAGGGTANLANQILANRTATMGEAIALSYDDGWKKLGGGLALYFTLTSAYNRYGCWGITDDYSKPDRNFKMQALRDLLASATGVEVVKPQASDANIGYDPGAAEIVVTTAPGVNVERIEIFNAMGVKIGGTRFSRSMPVRIGSGVYVVEARLSTGMRVSRLYTAVDGMLMPTPTTVRTLQR